MTVHNLKIRRSYLRNNKNVSDKSPFFQPGPVVPDQTQAPKTVENVVGSSGRPLDSATRFFMESKFNHDFGQVQIHHDSHANESSSDIHALAYTHGQHIVFGPGQYQPDSYSGKKLLAHELTHVMQQKSASIHRKGDPKIDKATFFRENCFGVDVDPQHEKCEFKGKEEVVIRLAKEYAIRKCGSAILALDIMSAEELNGLAKTIFHVDKAPPRKDIRTTIETVRTKLETTPIICKTCSDENCNKGGIFAYTPNDHSSLDICPLFFNNEKLTETPRFILHEGCHLADVDINNFLSKMHSEGYCKPEKGKSWENPCPDDNDNLTNADAWSYFIDRLSLFP
jgi:hypothetical protein